MSLWAPLVADALVGTARRPPTTPAAAGPLRDVLEELAAPAAASETAEHHPDESEARLLATAATVATYRLAGRRPERDEEPLPAPCEPDPRPLVGALAADHLARLLDGEFPGVLAEWLHLAAAAGWRAPEEHLPALLEAGRTTPALRPPVAATAGVRGRWLATQRDRWAWAAGTEDADTTWATGSAGARRLLVTGLRASDPVRARELLTSTWRTERPEDRAAFVGALATGLSDDDEEFLEAALDDRRKEVRRAAARLLARLPRSGLAARMAGRTEGLLRVEGRVRRRLEVSVPGTLDDAAARDGIDAAAPPGRGAGAWRLEQLLGATPLHVWPDRLGQPPPALVRLASGSDHAQTVLEGWATAAARQRDLQWATALLAHVARPDLLAVLPPEQAQATAVAALPTGALTADGADIALACPPPWGPALTDAVLRGLAVAGRQPPGDASYPLRERLPALALRTDPHAAADADRLLAEPDQWWRAAIDRFVELLVFRGQMRAQLTTPDR